MVVIACWISFHVGFLSVVSSSAHVWMVVVVGWGVVGSMVESLASVWAASV